MEIIHSLPGMTTRTGGRRNACVQVKWHGFLIITSRQRRVKKRTSGSTDRCGVQVFVYMFMNMRVYLWSREREGVKERWIF